MTVNVTKLVLMARHRVTFELQPTSFPAWKLGELKTASASPEAYFVDLSTN